MSRPTRTQLFLAGRWHQSGSTTSITSPWSGDSVADVSLATKLELEEAAAAAKSVAAAFRKSKRHVRSAICSQIARGIAERGEEIAQLITLESAKPIQYARAEVARAVTTFTLAAEEAQRFVGEILPLDITRASENYTGYYNRVALGPVAAIAPFNFPLNLVAHKIAPALAVGCPIVLKPAPQTPLTALLLAEIMESAELPPGVVSVLPMANATAEQMVRDERFKVLSFTGSARVGWYLKSICGRKRALLELGGNAPAIVHSDADLDHAAQRLIVGSFASSGQVCIKAQRLLIHQDVYDRFLELFVELARQVKVGDPADPETVVGPLIDTASADRVEEWISEARNAGARVLLEGPRSGNTIPPTILANVPPTARCLKEEIFAPVVTVESYATLDEAIARANATDYGLQAALFTFDTRVKDQAVSDLEYGGIIVNDSPMVRMDNYPYGGSKQSGLGREGVRYAMQEFSEPRVVVSRTIH